MARTTRTRSAAGRQLAIAVPRDAWTGVGLAVTPDEDGDQLDIFEALTERAEVSA